MLLRWLRRRRWRRTAAFEEDVALAIAEMRQLHGDAALDHARRKAKRRDQRTRRKWVWREVVKRLERSASMQTSRPVQVHRIPAIDPRSNTNGSMRRL